MILRDSSDTRTNLISPSQKTAILALDSSTQVASVALWEMGAWDKGRFLFSEQCVRQKSHSEWINGALERAVQTLPHLWQDLALIAVCSGPGSFTGVRVATNVAKSLAYGLKIPIKSYNSLEILAEQSELSSATYIMPMINAFKNMVFTALFLDQRSQNKGLKLLAEPIALDVQAIPSWLKKADIDPTKVQVMGDGYQTYPKELGLESNLSFVRPQNPLDAPLAKTLISKFNQEPSPSSFLTWQQLVPLYLRGSAAEENAASTLS